MQENIEVKTTENQKELIIRQGEASPVREPEPLHIVGDIMTVYEFLSKRTIDPHNSHIKVVKNSSSAVINLNIDETSQFKGLVQGVLSTSNEFDMWKINSDQTKGVSELAQFMKKKKRHFVDQSAGMKVIHELLNFKPKVEKSLEKMDDQRGNQRYKKEQAVDHNLPPSFSITIPLFEGESPVTVNVEFLIDPNTFDCCLISDELEEKMEKQVDERINEELNKIRELMPELPIIYTV